MKQRSWLWGLAVLAVAFAAWWIFRTPQDNAALPEPPKVKPVQVTETQGTPPVAPEPVPPPEPLPNVPVPKNMPIIPYTAEQKGETAHPETLQEIERAQGMLRDFRTLFGENPVGTNAEIMAALNGGNAKQARLGPPDGQGLNAKGELVDRWGTPYFFHQVDGQNMEIHSAGADKVLGTADDVVTR